MTTTRRAWLRGGAATAALALLGQQAWRHGHDYVFADQFAEVVPGKLYRGAWQQPWPMRRIVRDYKIRTVLALAHPDEHPLSVRERALGKELGFRWVHIPIVDERGLKDYRAINDKLEQAAALLADPANYPLYFHCHHGINRASMVQMAYRTKYCGWTLEQATDEIARTFGLVAVSKGPDYRHMQSFYAEHVLPYRQQAQAQPAAASPALAAPGARSDPAKIARPETATRPGRGNAPRARLIRAAVSLQWDVRPCANPGGPGGRGVKARTPGVKAGVLGVPRLNIRPARVGDVPAIQDLIRTFADRKLMIRRSLGELYESIREFLVATDDSGRVIGCVALHVFWDDLAELKCLAVGSEAHGRGVGRRLLEACWDAARELEIKTVFTLTYVPGFFEKCGYHQVEKADLPHKIWNECVRCPLFPNCNEVALIRSVAADPLGVAVNGRLATVGV